MAIAASALGSVSSGTNATSYSTGSQTPTANALVLAAVVGSLSGTPPQPTLSGNGLTWVLVDSRAYDTSGTQYTLWVFRAMGASPSAGALTASFGATTMAGGSISVVQFTGVDTSGTNGSGAIVQSATNQQSAVTTGSATLAAFSSVNNATYGAISWEADEAGTQGSGFTLAHSVHSAGPSTALLTEYKLSNDTSVDCSWTTSTGFGAVAIEVKADTGSSTVTPSSVGNQIAVASTEASALAPGAVGIQVAVAGTAVDTSGGGGTPTFQTAATTTWTDNPTSKALNMPTGITAGDVLLAVVTAASSALTLTMTGWTAVYATQGGGSFESTRAFWKVAAGSDTATAGGLGNQNGSAVVLRFSGVDTTTPINTFATSGPTIGGTPSCPAVTTTTDNCLIVYTTANNIIGTLTAPTGSTQRGDAANGSTDTQTGVSTLNTLKSPAGTVAATDYGTDAFTEWITSTIALAPGTGGSGTATPSSVGIQVAVAATEAGAVAPGAVGTQVALSATVAAGATPTSVGIQVAIGGTPALDARPSVSPVGTQVAVGGTASTSATVTATSVGTQVAVAATVALDARPSVSPVGTQQTVAATGAGTLAAAAVGTQVAAGGTVALDARPPITAVGTQVALSVTLDATMAPAGVGTQQVVASTGAGTLSAAAVGTEVATGGTPVLSAGPTVTPVGIQVAVAATEAGAAAPGAVGTQVALSVTLDATVAPAAVGSEVAVGSTLAGTLAPAAVGTQVAVNATASTSAVDAVTVQVATQVAVGATEAGTLAPAAVGTEVATGGTPALDARPSVSPLGTQVAVAVTGAGTGTPGAVGTQQTALVGADAAVALTSVGSEVAIGATVALDARPSIASVGTQVAVDATVVAAAPSLVVTPSAVGTQVALSVTLRSIGGHVTGTTTEGTTDEVVAGGGPGGITTSGNVHEVVTDG